MWLTHEVLLWHIRVISMIKELTPAFILIIVVVNVVLDRKAGSWRMRSLWSGVQITILRRRYFIAKCKAFYLMNSLLLHVSLNLLGGLRFNLSSPFI